MTAYLYFIGTANALGTLLLLGALSEGFADGLLRRWTQILPADAPYEHSAYGRLWLWWAIIGTGFFAAINMVAASWPPSCARVVVFGNIYCYLSFEALAIAGSLSPRFGPGVHVAHVLWLGQAGWGAYVAFLL